MKHSLLLVGLSLMTALISCSSAEQPVLNILVTPERSKVLRQSGDDVIFHVEVQGQNRKPLKRVPLNLAVVLDRSGSMSGAKLEQAKQAASSVVDQLSAGDVFSLVTYNTDVQVLVPAQQVGNRERLHSKINAIRCGGSTALYAGVEEGSNQVREYLDRNKINRVILLSDGMANVGPRSPADLARLGSRLVEDRINVTTIGLGDDYNEDLMMALAESSAANYYYVKDAEKLPGIFREELGYLQSVVARNIRIIIELPEGVTAVEIIGRPDVVFKNNRAELVLNEHYSSQSRSFLVRCRVSEGKSKTIELARVNTQYRDEVAGMDRENLVRASLELTDDRKVSEASLNAEVGRQTALARNAASRERALALADQGKTKEAAKVLKDQASWNLALPSAVRSQKLDSDNAALASTADVLEKDGQLDKANRKAFQYENYRQKNQKQ